MPNMLDYERLVLRVAELTVENEKLKGDDPHGVRAKEERRWRIIEEQPDVGTASEERRLRRIIRDWEERYDILNELFIKSSTGKTELNWHETKKEMDDKKWKQNTLQSQTFYTRIKALWAMIRKPN